jgi:Alpha-tubulin suppressor and related RCC1 domain-containing proteins
VTRCIRLMLGLLALVALAACSSDSATGLEGTCDVTNPVADLEVEPSSATVYYRSEPRASDSLRLEPAAFGRFGNPRSDVSFAYRSSDTTVAVVSQTGVVSPRRTGQTKVTVSTCGREAVADISVISDVASVKVTPVNATLVAGDSLMIGASATGLDGIELPGVVFTWSNDPSELASLDGGSESSALMHSLGAGTITVSAMAEGTSGQATVTVLPRIFLAGASSSTPGIAAGANYTCATISMGRGYCWGVDDVGQLGAPTDSSCFAEDSVGGGNESPCSLLPQRFADEIPFVSVSAGDRSACGISSDQHAYCWGSNDAGELGNGKTNGPAPSLVTSVLTFKQIDVGGSHACGIASDNAAYCWGRDLFGQLGDGRKVNSTTPIPVVVDQASGATVTFTSISAGSSHTCGVSSAGDVYCWGLNDHGQLGVSSTGETCGTPLVSCSSAPRTISSPAGLDFRAVTTGIDHSCALTTTGAAYCWGADSSGQLGDGSAGGNRSLPAAVTGGHSFTQIAGGGGFTCALEQGTGAAWCWGSNSDLQLGVGPYSGGDDLRSSPVKVGGDHTFAVLAAGMNHVCGVTTDGRAYCWGSDVYGALGNSLQAAFRGFPQEVATPQ